MQQIKKYALVLLHALDFISINASSWRAYLLIVRTFPVQSYRPTPFIPPASVFSKFQTEVRTEGLFLINF